MKKWKYVYGLAFIMGISVFILGYYYYNKQRDNFEKERDEFREEWKEHNKKRVFEKNSIYWDLIRFCIYHPRWNEFKEKYLQELEKSGIDINSKMFDDQINDPYLGYYGIERFIKLYYHRDSVEREKLREYNSFYIESWDDYKSYPYNLQDFESYNRSTGFSFIYEIPGYIIGGIVFLSLIMLICYCISLIKL